MADRKLEAARDALEEIFKIAGSIPASRGDSIDRTDCGPCGTGLRNIWVLAAEALEATE